MRALVPPVALVLLWLGNLAVVDSGSTTAATLALPVYAAILVLGAAGVYPAMRRRGAGVIGATAGALALPLLWIGKECWAMSRLYTPGEAAYYALNPVALGLLAASAVQMAAAELVLRRRRTGRWALRNGAGLTLVAVAVAAGLIAMATQHAGPTAVFWAYVQGHRRLFDGPRVPRDGVAVGTRIRRIGPAAWGWATRSARLNGVLGRAPLWARGRARW